MSNVIFIDFKTLRLSKKRNTEIHFDPCEDLFFSEIHFMRAVNEIKLYHKESHTYSKKKKKEYLYKSDITYQSGNSFILDNIVN